MSQTRQTSYAARFRRYECKYLISEATAQEVRRHLQPYVTVDPYAVDSPDHSYDITSLYLDSPDLRLFHETRNGLRKRLKLRIRSYSEQAGAPAFLEIKRRHNQLVLKGRTRLQREAVELMLDGGVPATHDLAGSEQACFDEFNAWTARWIAQPVVWVGYRREAYMGRHNSDVRITFDRALRCAPADHGYAVLGHRNWRPIEPRDVVLELKFTTAFPLWLSRLVQRIGLRQQSYSKYGNAVLRGLDPRCLPPAEAWALPAGQG